MNIGRVFLTFLVVFASLLVSFAMVSAATPIYNTGAGCVGSGGIAWRSSGGWDYTEWVSGYGVLPNINVSTPTTTGSRWIGSPSVPNGADSCSACGVTVSCTTTNILLGYTDTDAPNVTNPLPTNGTTLGSFTAFMISVTSSDDLNLVRVYANITQPDNSVVPINLTNSSATNWSASFTPSMNGWYHVRFFAIDSYGNLNNSVTTSFFVNVPISPNNTNSTNSTVPGNYSQNFIVFNLNLNIPLPYTLTVNLSNSTGLVNSTTLYNSSYVVFYNLPSENYTIRAVLTNGSGNTIYPPIGPIILDTSPPVLLNPNLPSGTYSVLPIRFNVTLNEPGIVWYSIDGGVSNTTMQTSNNIFFNGTINNISNGNYFFRLFWKDLLNNSNTTMTGFTVSIPGAGPSIDDVIPSGHTNERISGNFVNNLQPEVINDQSSGEVAGVSKNSNVVYYSVITLLLFGILLLVLLLWLLFR